MYIANLSQIANGLYGELRGYKRWSIRREVERNTRLPAEGMRARAESLFARRVADAVARFPEYADKVRAHRGSLPAAGERVDAAGLPLWTKTDQRALFERLGGPPIPSAYEHSSSGSTGVPVRFYITRESYEWRTAVWDRGYGWAGAEEGRSSFYIQGIQQTGGGSRHRIKKAVQQWVQRRRMLDGFQAFDDEQKAIACDVLNRTRPEVLVGYSSYLADLARFVRDGRASLSARVQSILPIAEMLQPGQRELLEETFGGRVFLTYGCREFMLIGAECGEHSGYHLSSDNLHVEVLDDDNRPVAPGETGRIVVSDLHNDATPFVRYDVGDLGTTPADDAPCRCGLPFPLLASVDGRRQDTIYRADGSKITAIFTTSVIRRFEWVDAYQIVQSKPGAMTIRVITPAELTPERTEPLSAKLRERLGADMHIDYEKAEELVTRPNGKVALVISDVER